MPVTAAKPFHPQHVERLRGGGDPRRQRGGVGEFGQRHDEAVEVIVIVFLLRIVQRAAVLDVVFYGEAEADQRRRIDLAVGDSDDLHRSRQRAGDGRHRLVEAARVDQVALVQHDEVGAGDLVGEHLLDRIVVVERGIGGALARERCEIGGDAAFGQRRAVHHRDDAVHGDAALDRRPVKRLHQRLRQCETGSFDDDVLDARIARENSVERRHELVGDGAAEAAIRQFDDVLLRARLVAAALEDFAVDADIAEFVDDHRKPPSAGIGEHVADQRRLAGAEKAGHHRAGHARKRDGHSGSSSKSSGGTRATMPRLSDFGRPCQGNKPSGSFASMRAATTRSAPPSSASPLKT